MSAVKKPSSVSALRRGIGTTATPAIQDQEHVTDLPGPVPDRRPRKEKPVRFTLDLDRDLHRFLKEHAVGIEADASQVLRALLNELRDDPDLAARIRNRIWP
jgi:hypothetical protein